MSYIPEAGVLPQSERRFATPSAIARALFYYVTRCGHYTITPDYDFRDDSAVGRTESHQTYMLLYVASGRMELHNDGNIWTAEAGQLSFINCRKSHRFHALLPTEMIWVHLDGANTADFFTQFLALHGGRQLITLPGGSAIPADMLRILEGLRRSEMTESERSQFLHRILCSLTIPPRAEGEPAAVITEAITYMNAHLHEDIPVSVIAAAVQLSPAHFSRLFKSRTGYSPHEYIVLHRIDEAKVLLHSTPLSVKEIAYRVGYHSEVNFISSFTHKVGISPAAFRRRPL